VVFVLALVGIMCIFPLLFVVSVSVTPYSEVLKNGGLVLVPKNITFDAYKHLLFSSNIPRAFGVTFFITIVGTAINSALTALMPYPVSRKALPGRTMILLFVVFPMIYNGGIIPTYLIVQATGLMNSLWEIIVPNATRVFNILV